MMEPKLGLDVDTLAEMLRSRRRYEATEILQIMALLPNPEIERIEDAYGASSGRGAVPLETAARWVIAGDRRPQPATIDEPTPGTKLVAREILEQASPMSKNDIARRLFEPRPPSLAYDAAERVITRLKLLSKPDHDDHEQCRRWLEAIRGLAKESGTEPIEYLARPGAMDAVTRRLYPKEQFLARTFRIAAFLADPDTIAAIPLEPVYKALGEMYAGRPVGSSPPAGDAATLDEPAEAPSNTRLPKRTEAQLLETRIHALADRLYGHA